MSKTVCAERLSGGTGESQQEEQDLCVPEAMVIS